MRGLPKLPGLKGLRGRLGLSRGKEEPAGSWADFEMSAEQWRSTQSPQAARTKAQRRAAMMVYGMLSTLPLSAGACLVAMSSSGNVSDLQDQQTQTSQAVTSLIERRDATPRMSGLAVTLTEAWLGDAGRVLTPLEAVAGAAVCGPADRECETHTLLVELGEPGSGRRFAALVAVDSQSGSLPYPPTLTASAYGADQAPEPEGTETFEGAGLPEAAAGLMEQWRLAWGGRDQLKLLELAGEDDGTLPVLAEPWQLVENIPLRRLWHVGDGSSWWVTVAVAVRDGCATLDETPNPDDPAAEPVRVCVPGPPIEITQLVSLAQTGEFLRITGSGDPTSGPVGVSQ